MNWTLWILDVIVGIAGLWLVCWSLFADRSKGGPRCPKCWYNMHGVPGLRCPECDRTAKREAKLHKTRRRWRWTAVGVIALMGAAASGLGPTVREHGIGPLVPTSILLLALPDPLGVEDQSNWALEIIQGRIAIDPPLMSARFVLDGRKRRDRKVVPLERDALWCWQWRRLAEYHTQVALHDFSGAGYSAVLFLDTLPDPNLAIDSLIECMSASNEDAAIGAIQSIQGIWDRAHQGRQRCLPALLTVLDGDSVSFKQAAIYAIGQMGEVAEPVVPVLVELLEDAELRGDATWALGELGPFAAPAIPALLPWLDDDDLSWRVACALTAIDPMHPEVRDALLASSRSENPHRRWGTVGAFAEFPSGDELAREVILGALHDPSWRVQMTAAILSRDLGEAARDAIPTLTRMVRNEPLDANDDSEPGSASHSFLVRAGALRSLVDICSPDEVEPLFLEALADESVGMRDEAVSLVLESGIDPDKVVEHLLPLLDDPDSMVRGQVAHTLASLYDRAQDQQGIIEGLRRLTSDPEMGESAAYSLRTIEGKDHDEQ